MCADASDDFDTTTVIKKQDNVIELKGSLSDVYTKALNAEYALENIQSIVNSIISDNAENKIEPVYVEVIDKDEVENQDVLALSKNLRVALDKHSNKRSIVVLESDSASYKTIPGMLKFNTLDSQLFEFYKESYKGNSDHLL